MDEQGILEVYAVLLEILNELPSYAIGTVRQSAALNKFVILDFSLATMTASRVYLNAKISHSSSLSAACGRARTRR